VALNVKAAAIRGKGAAFVLEDLELDDPRPDEILVRMVATGMCHTDLTLHNNPVALPIVLGHEGAGVVERVGEGITKVKPGDHVILSYL
jgi:aryl-alcohol dehydrogenase